MVGVQKVYVYSIVFMFFFSLVSLFFGSAIGLLLSRARTRPRRGVLGGAVGGIVGAWAGFILYYFASPAHEEINAIGLLYYAFLQEQFSSFVLVFYIASQDSIDSFFWPLWVSSLVGCLLVATPSGWIAGGPNWKAKAAGVADGGPLS